MEQLAPTWTSYTNETILLSSVLNTPAKINAFACAFKYIKVGATAHSISLTYAFLTIAGSSGGDAYISTVILPVSSALTKQETTHFIIVPTVSPIVGLTEALKSGYHIIETATITSALTLLTKTTFHSIATQTIITVFSNAIHSILQVTLTNTITLTLSEALTKGFNVLLSAIVSIAYQTPLVGSVFHIVTGLSIYQHFSLWWPFVAGLKGYSVSWIVLFGVTFGLLGLLVGLVFRRKH
jgi:hypothetical protein